MANAAQMFDNGLSGEELAEIDAIGELLANAARRMVALPPHRSYSLAVTKLEEAVHWLRDRKFKPPNPSR